MKILGGTAVLLAAIALTGCSTQTESSTPTETPRAAQTPTYATEQQVASVLAEYEPDMRRIIDNASNCRLQSVTNPTSPQVTACGYDEQTIGLDAQLTARGWSDLNIPPQMRDLVTETTTTLLNISDIDVVTPCGDGFATVTTDDCSAALGSRNLLYTQLESKLNAWAPYL